MLYCCGLMESHRLIAVAASLLLIHCGVITAAHTVGGPSVYVILSDQLPIHYRLDSVISGAYISLYKQGSDTELDRQTVQGVVTGVVEFPCGVVITTGYFEARLYDPSGSVLATSILIEAVWPKFNLTLPATHIAQQDTHPDLLTRYIDTRITCKAPDDISPFSLDVQYSRDASFTQNSIIHQELNINLRKLNSNTTSLRCELFDRQGYYRIVLKDRLTDIPISTSNSMDVTWGDYYKLSSPQQSIFPCTDNLVIDFTRPKCVTREDNIHMFAIKAGEIVGQREMEYMYEAKARVGESSTSFSCDDIRSYHWRAQAISYCFRYQTVASNQAVTDHELFCMPTNKTIGLPVDGQWSSWAAWSKCSGNCEWGRQSRYRYCNSPTPSNGGKFCEGGVSVEWKECQSGCNPVVSPGTPSIVIPSRPSDKIPDCWCDCSLTKPVGVLIPGRKCVGSTDFRVHIKWIIQVNLDSTMKLNITAFKWSLASQSLKVRDGSGYNGQLLLDLKGNKDSSDQSVISSGNSLHIEFMSTEPVPAHPDLFIISYHIIVPDASSALPPIANIAREDEPVWRLPAIVAGSVGGFVIVITLIGVCAYRRVNTARTPTVNRTKQSVNMDTSPNHVVIQVQNGDYTNFGDVTIAPSVQTVKSSKKSAAEREKKKRRHRDKDNNLEAILENGILNPPLPDPYHVKPEDFLHDTDLLHHRNNTVDKQKLHKSAHKQASKQKKRRRPKHRRGGYDDPREVDKLISSLPLGSQSYPTMLDPDSEYRALINHLSSTTTDSPLNQSEQINTSAEIHLVPHTTPVQDSSQELSPLTSPNGQRSPCLDDGYNSLANTGSTQSNLSSRGREPLDPPRLNRIKEKNSSRSENSSELSPKLPDRTEQRHSVHSCGVTTPRIHRHSTHSCSTEPLSSGAGGLNTNNNSNVEEELHLSHLTCPLQRPDGQSDNEESHSADESQPPLTSTENSTQSSPKLNLPSLAPPTVFADKLNDSHTPKPAEGPRLMYIKRAGSQTTPSQSTNSDSYEYDDFLPPPVSEDPLLEDSMWPSPPISEENSFLA